MLVLVFAFLCVTPDLKSSIFCFWICGVATLLSRVLFLKKYKQFSWINADFILYCRSLADSIIYFSVDPLLKSFLGLLVHTLWTNHSKQSFQEAVVIEMKYVV